MHVHLCQAHIHPFLMLTSALSCTCGIYPGQAVKPTVSQPSSRGSSLHPVAPPHGSQWPSCFSGSFCVCIAVYCILKGKLIITCVCSMWWALATFSPPRHGLTHDNLVPVWVDSEITTPYQSLPGRVGSEASSSCSPQWPLPTALSCSFYPAGLLSSCHGHLTSDAFVLSQVAKLMLHTHLWRHSLILELGTQAYYLDISQ